MRPSSTAAIVVLVAASAALSGCSTSLNEKSARAVVEATEAAWKQANIDEVEKYISSDCKIHESGPSSNGGTESRDITCQQSLQDMRKFVASANASGATREYQSTTPTITIEGDKAIAHLRATETLSKGDKNLESVSEQVETLQLRDGKVLITTIDVHAVSATANGQRIF